MAWIVKNSASMVIERRNEPYLDDQLKATLEAEVMVRYPTRQAAMLPVLHAIQEKHNWIAEQAIEETAEFLGLTPAQVLDTATFYEQFFLHRKGKYLIMICQSLSCELMGQKLLLQALQQKLGIEPGQTTDNGKFTLVTAECLGACDGAPCALVDEKLHEQLTIENLEQVLNSLG